MEMNIIEGLKERRNGLRLKPGENIMRIKSLTMLVVMLSLSSCATQYQKSVDTYEQTWADAYVNQGNVNNDKGQYDQAISYYTEAIEINPSFAEAYVNRGNVYHAKGQYDQAISDYNKAIEINPNSCEECF